MADYTLCEPFDIDDGELDGLGPQLVFCLGVEWQLTRQELESGEPFERTIHTENSARLLAMCERHGRKAKVTWLHDDYETWRVLTVEPK
jgi:hypothetical protein